MRSARVLIILVVTMALAACSSSNNAVNDPAPTVPALLASGGTGSNGTGGTGGEVYIESYGSVKVLRSGTANNAGSVASAVTPSFGTNPAVVSAGTTTTVLLDADDFSGNLCTATGDTNLYIGDGNGTCGDGGDFVVTGLTVDTGATLILVDQGFGYATLRLTNDLMINGTLTTDVNTTSGLDIEASIIDVQSGGMITSSATTTDNSAGAIYLGNGNGMTKQIINHGTIEAKGLGSGSGGYMYFEPDELVVNYGTIDVSGGSSDTGNGGSGGELDVYVDYGDFYSYGTVRMNGGAGATSGGDSEAEYYNYNGYSAWIETAYYGNSGGRNGDIFISGTWEANGGDGADGNGGVGGYIWLQTDALGAVTISATMSAKGGNSAGTGYYGGNTYGIDFYSYLDPNGWGGYNDPVTPGKISITGQYDIRGGNGDQNGGNGGYFEIYNYNNTNAAGIGSDVELVGFPSMAMNGGDSATNGGNASTWAFEIYTYSAGNAAGPITNEAAIEARGGNAASTGTGGMGGYVEMMTIGIDDPAEVVSNSGSIDVSGGTGDTGGAGYTINLQAQHVTNSGNLTANGGAGTTQGGNGGSITLTSTDLTTPTAYTGVLRAAGGGGTTAGGTGTKTVDGTVIP